MKLQLKKTQQDKLSIIFETGDSVLDFEKILKELDILDELYIEGIFTDDGIQIKAGIPSNVCEVLYLREMLSELDNEYMGKMYCIIAADDIQVMNDILNVTHNFFAYEIIETIDDHSICDVYSSGSRDKYIKLNKESYVNFIITEDIYSFDSSYFEQSIRLTNGNKSGVIKLPNLKETVDRVFKSLGISSIKETDIEVLDLNTPKLIRKIISDDMKQSNKLRNVERYFAMMNENNEILKAKKLDANSYISYLTDIFEPKNIDEAFKLVIELAEFKIIRNIDSYEQYGKYILEANNLKTTLKVGDFGYKKAIENSGVIIDNYYVEYTGDDKKLIELLNEMGASIEAKQINQNIKIQNTTLNME